MVERCDYYSNEEYEYAKQLEEDYYREQLELEEEFSMYYEVEYMKEQFFKEITDKINNYLQNDCADEWHVKLEEKYIVGYYTDIKEFTLVFDEDFGDWYISCEYLDVDIVAEINNILQEYTD